MQEYWESYMKPIEGKKAMVSFNAGVSDFVPDEAFLYVGFLKIKLKEPKEDGLVNEKESDDVSFIEDRLEMESLRYRAGKYIGRIISNGEVNFIYYLKMDFEWKDTVLNAMNHFKDYEYEVGSRMDTEWEVYQKLLFPSVREWQIIANHHACDNLKSEGDELKTKRAIEHKIYFNTLEEKEKFKSLIEADNFKIQDEIELSKDKIVKYGLKFYRVDSAFYYDIDALTMNLIDYSDTCNGQYDGWESSLVKG